MNFYQSEFPSIYRGKVEANDDPKNLGRCRIRIPSVHGNLTYPIELLPWARPVASSTVNGSRGSFNIPDVGDIVWVMFEGSNKDYPVYLGGTYAVSDIPIDKSIVLLYAEGNNAIVYNRTTKSYSINIGDNKIEVNEEDILISNTDRSISLDKDKISIVSDDNKIEINGEHIQISNTDNYVSLNKNRVSIKSQDSYVIVSDNSILLDKGSNSFRLTDSDVEVVGNVKIIGDLEVTKNLSVSGDYPCRAE